MKLFVNYQEGASSLLETIERDSTALNEQTNKENLYDLYKQGKLATISSGQLPPDKPNLNVNWFAYHVGNANQDLKINHKLNKPFKYLFLNALPRDHRVLLLRELNSRFLLGESLWSDLMGAMDGQIKKLPDRYDTPRDDLIDHLSLVDNSAKINIDLYHDTYFSLVTETVFWDQPYGMLTEKFYKSVMACHPFIIAANPGIYDYIHELGFKTFEPWIDESFDKEKNLNIRMHMICNQVELLSRSNLRQFVRDTWPIVEHNANRLIEICKTWDQDTVKKVLQFHLTHNIDATKDQVIMTNRYKEKESA